VSFVVFVAGVAAALYVLMPAARARPAPLVGVVTLALGWAGVARRAREEYLVDQPARTLTARRVGLLGLLGLLGRREEQMGTHEISAVRLDRRGPDNDRLVVELVGIDRRVRLRLPRRVNTLTAHDQSTIARLLAEQLGVPLQAG
jgi:hypothetical protein